MNLSYFWYRFKFRHGKNLPLRTPVDVSLELSSECNQKCIYCYHAASNEPNLKFVKGLMTKDLAFKIIKESAAIGVNSLKFNYRGESTINPHFAEITAYAKSLARGSTFIDRLTNSNFKFMTNREDIFKGLANQTKVKISYDSFNKEVFETQRAGGDHAKTTRNIDKFYNHPARIKSGTEIVIQAVRTKLNKDEDIAGLSKKRWPSATISIRDVVEGRLDNEIDELANKHRDTSERQSCLQAHVRLMVHWDGKTNPCCPAIDNNLIIGDLNRKSVKEVFNSMIAKELRKDLKSGRAFKSRPACMNCSSFESYKNFVPTWNS